MATGIVQKNKSYTLEGDVYKVEFNTKTIEDLERMLYNEDDRVIEVLSESSGLVNSELLDVIINDVQTMFLSKMLDMDTNDKDTVAIKVAINMFAKIRDKIEYCAALYKNYIDQRSEDNK